MKKKNNTNLVGIKDRFLKAIAYLKGNMIIKYDKDIAERLETYTSNFSKAKKGDAEYLTENFITRFCDEYGFNKDWIMNNDGEMTTSINSNNTNSYNKIKGNNNLSHNKDCKDEIEILYKEIKALKKQIELLEKNNALQEKIINSLEK